MDGLLKQQEYKFLDSLDVQMLCYGGSISYGTNLPDKSDIDIRGFINDDPRNILLGKFSEKAFEDGDTDTGLHYCNRYIELLSNCNPNIIEQLGCKEEHYLYKSELAQELIDNSDKFLSKRAVRSFSGYAYSQLSRLENAISNSGVDKIKKAEQTKRTLDHMIPSFNEKYNLSEYGSIEIVQQDSSLLLNMNVNGMPIGNVNTILSELKAASSTYDKLAHRNRKKDEEHLDKHAMHLIRLFYMAIDILEDGKIITYREKEKDFLLSIRNGKFRNEDGTYQKEFFDIVADLRNRLEQLEKTTPLPDNPDREWIDSLVMRVNREVALSYV